MQIGAWWVQGTERGPMRREQSREERRVGAWLLGLFEDFWVVILRGVLSRQGLS